MAMSLDELKAINAEADANGGIEDEPPAQPEGETDTPEAPETEDAGTTPPAEEQPPEELDENGDPVVVDDGANDWMKSGDDDDPDSKDNKPKKYSDGDMARQRIKLKAKVNAEKDENAKLREENLKLQQRNNQQQNLTKPNPDDYTDDNEYQEAMVDYRMDKRDANNRARQTADERRIQQNDEQVRINEDVDSHYERAVVLADASGISEDNYRNADLRVRTMVDSLFAGNGDIIVDGLISKLGEGSEKVMFNLGVNKARLKELENSFRDDPTGVKASMFLGKLNAELSAPSKRRTNAPAPAHQVNGDKVPSATSKALRKAYDEQDGQMDLTERFRIKREARAKGIDTSDW